MRGRFANFNGAVPQFEDVQCLVDQVTHACQLLRCRPKDFELPVQDVSQVHLSNLSIWSFQSSRSAAHRKAGNVPMISPTGVPGFDQLEPFAKLKMTSLNDWSPR